MKFAKFFKRKTADPMTAVRGDALVLATIRKQRPNLESAVVEHFLYFPNEDAANTAGRALNSGGFVVEVRPAAEGNDWTVLAQRHDNLAESAIADLRAYMTELGAAGGGEYDGWGVPVPD